MTVRLEEYRYDGPLPKVHAGGYAFRSGRVVRVNAAFLSPATLADFKKHGVEKIGRKPVPAPVSTPAAASEPITKPTATRFAKKSDE